MHLNILMYNYYRNVFIIFCADNIVDCLGKRMDDMKKDSVLALFRTFDHQDWPKEREDLAAHGKDDLHELFIHYEELFQRFEITEKVLKTPKMSMTDIFSSILSSEEKRKQFPALGMLMEIFLLVPVNTAVCERGFSTMKRTKNDTRSCLSTCQLRKLMYTSIEGPPEDQFDAEGAVSQWWKSGESARRPGFNPWEAKAKDEGEILHEELMRIEEEQEQQERARQEHLVTSLDLQVEAGAKRLDQDMDSDSEDCDVEVDEDEVRELLKQD